MSRARFIYTAILLAGFAFIIFVIAMVYGCNPSPTPPNPEPTVEPTTEPTLPPTGQGRH